MGGFLRENWKWIVLPIVLLIGVLLAIVIFGGSGNDTPFQYNDF
jgi:hypothetical protein